MRTPTMTSSRARHRELAPAARHVLAACCIFALSVTSTLCSAATISGMVTSADGKPVADAVVFVQEGDAPAATTTPSATMDQMDKTFVPSVLPVVVGTRVRFPNHDQIHHHVYSFSRTKTFELPLYKGEDASPVLFDKVGVVKVGCNIHDWMAGVILVLPTPWFARTDNDGRFTLSVPDGEHTLVAWHELSKQKPEDTAKTVPAGASPADVNFSLTLGAARPRPAMRGSRRDP
jgi:plastocyanin